MASSQTCAICIEEAPPCQAVRLVCHHGWYCTDCIRKHCEARIEAGAVEVRCPECGMQVSERHLRLLLPARDVDRLLSRSLGGAAGLRHCPTPDCPNIVAMEEGDSTFRLDCLICKKDSCLKCLAQPYHHGQTCEEHAGQKKKFEEDDTKRKRKRKAERSEQDEDDMSSFLRWMEDTGTKPCPGCSTAISKQNLQKQRSQSEECHKMVCRNCGTRFCFKCLTVLTPTSTCGCTGNEHGFINPKTGKFMAHLSKKALSVRAPAQSSARPQSGNGKGRPGRGSQGQPSQLEGRLPRHSHDGNK